jgi:hypothetical protein
MAKKLLIKDLPADHPIYTRGFVIGGKTSSHFPENTQGKDSNKESKKPSEEESKEDKK